MFFLLIINIVILIQVRLTHALWRKPLTDKQIQSVTEFTLYPLIIGLVCTAVAFLLISHTSVNQSRATQIFVTILTFVPTIALFISVVGVLWVYYTADGRPTGTRRTGGTMTLQQAAKYLQISQDELLTMVQNGGIKARKIKGEYSFDPEILAAFRSTRS